MIIIANNDNTDNLTISYAILWQNDWHLVYYIDPCCSNAISFSDQCEQ